MAVDLRELTQNLVHFYDFRDKIVLYVGAGGHQLLDPSAGTRKLIAIDQDAESLQELKANIAARAWQNSIDVVAASFDNVTLSGDVVYFEFCLHEMNDPGQALRHALTLAPEVLIFDHLPDSEWAFHAAEEDKVQRSTDVLAGFACTRRQAFRTEQRFPEYQQLLDKVSCQGELALKRAERYSGKADIAIPMTYGLALLDRETCRAVDVG